ncbi:hypothetical protein [Oceanirhabdus seepicola]|uniref:Uncharacterized protein n=1 Tax=Oceanirhabdus seepicola TaxID=2828781 RepID=A0A9J6PEU8_9CLOT|nr:hypothetical protein [Oceanirhabdus seepicola]MCM1992792.1 hypothetical protein [Oceanirhabdus seepicola]
MDNNPKLKETLNELCFYLPLEVQVDIEAAYDHLLRDSKNYCDAIQRLRKAGEAITALMVEALEYKPAVSRSGSPKTIASQLKYIDDKDFVFSMEVVREKGNDVSHSSLGKDKNRYNLEMVYEIFKNFINCVIIYITRGLHEDDITEKLNEIEKKHSNNKYNNLSLEQPDAFESEDKNQELDTKGEKEEQVKYDETNDENKNSNMSEAIENMNFQKFHIKNESFNNNEILKDYSFIKSARSYDERRIYQKKTYFDIDGIEIEKSYITTDDIGEIISTYEEGDKYKLIKGDFDRNKNKRLIIIGSEKSRGKRSTAIKLLRELKKKNEIFYFSQVDESIKLYNLKKYLKDKNISYNKSYIIRMHISDLFDLNKKNTLDEINLELKKKHSYMVIISQDSFDDKKYNEYYYSWNMDINLEKIMKNKIKFFEKSSKKYKKYIEKLKEAEIFEELKQVPISPSLIAVYVRNILEKDPQHPEFASQAKKAYPANLKEEARNTIENNKNDLDVLCKLLCLSLFRKLNKPLFNDLSESLMLNFSELVNEEERQEFMSKERLLKNDSYVAEKINAKKEVQIIKSNYGDIEESFIEFENTQFYEKVLENLLENYTSIYKVIREWILKRFLYFNPVLVQLFIPSFKYLFINDKKTIINTILSPLVKKNSKYGIKNICTLINALIEIDNENFIIEFIERVKGIKKQRVKKIVLNSIPKTLHKKYPFRTIMILRHYIEKASSIKEIDECSLCLSLMIDHKVIRDNRYIALEALENWCFDCEEDEFFRTKSKYIYLNALYYNMYKSDYCFVIEYSENIDLLEEQILPLYELILKDKFMLKHFIEYIFNEIKFIGEKKQDLDEKVDIIENILTLVLKEIKLSDKRYRKSFFPKINYWLRKYSREFKAEKNLIDIVLDNVIEDNYERRELLNEGLID